jgi:RimJ/RimL family protein N-acetyltransferase
VYINFETERLKLRPITLKDADFIIDLVNSNGWLEFIGDRNVSNKKDAENYIQKILDNKNYYYNIFELKTSRKAIGIITFLKREDEIFPDIGFALLPEFEKNGYAFEASKSYLKRIKSLNRYENLIAITLPDNIKSINLLHKLGLQYTGNHKKGETILSYYSLKNKNYPLKTTD